MLDADAAIEAKKKASGKGKGKGRSEKQALLSDDALEKNYGGTHAKRR